MNALTCDDRELALEALDLIATDTWHQTTIYESSARLTPILLRAVKDLRAPRGAILELLAHYAESLAPNEGNPTPCLVVMLDAFRQHAAVIDAFAERSEKEAHDAADRHPRKKQS